MQWRTDLAVERYTGFPDVQGVKSEQKNMGDIIRHDVTIETEAAARTLGKEMGHYVTLCDEMLARGDCEETQRKALAKALSDAVTPLLPVQGSVLVVGLGNRHITADALGSRVVEKMLVTRQMQGIAPVFDELRSVCAVAPGVLGITGIETAEMVRGVVDRVKPRVVIAIDALAARESRRICTTIQVTDTGISPGSGVGNHRVGLHKTTLGVPVIAVGVPMVVYASVIARDALSLLVRDLDVPEDAHAQAIDQMVEKVTAQSLGELVVTPRDVDELVGRVAGIVALGLNMALQKTLDAEDILMLTNDHM